MKLCKKCNLKLNYSNKSGFCKKCKSPAKTRSEIISEFRRKRKKLLVEYKGGKCEICGYNKCIGALEFHHKNPIEKNFGIAKKGTTKSWKKDKKEVDKCILICANCHREKNEQLFINKAYLL